MELKGRLKLIASKTVKCDTVCDVGTDHAYIPIYLVENNICKKAIACDVKPGPIMAAKKHIGYFGLSKFIDARLGDGLDPIEENEANVVIIAGMGGYLISRIISDGISKVKNCDNIVLQPMNEAECLRKWLYENGFEIQDEELTNEGEKIYNVITTKWTGKPSTRDEVYYHFGEKLFERNDPLLKTFIEKKIWTFGKIVKEMDNLEPDKAVLREHYQYLLEGFEKLVSRLK
ncbi:MAG TPA: class I SAM-dependent methyltransferase [Pseudobacteroides sp.]|uniref:tRNA (adenine(22)-N(1))-methyltransferase n=1 Tax=Pseudobacteroides sp. TaxID=1968840 RepID=UPI002F938791